jgi:hypothetical protein
VTLAALRDDALSSTSDGFSLRLSLPWIRSLPLASLDSLEVVIDGDPVRPIGIALRERIVEPSALSEERAWWFLQDRLAILGGRILRPGAHEVSVTFSLMIPYLQAGPDGPLTLPFHIGRALVLDAPAPFVSVSRDVA